MHRNPFLFYTSLLSPVLFLGGALFLGAITSDYDARKETISMLVLTSHGAWQTINFIVCGLLMVLLGVQTWRMKVASNLQVMVGGVIGLFGVIMLGLAMVPTDATLMPTTGSGWCQVLLFVAALLSFLLTTLGAGVVTRRSNPRYSAYSIGSMVVVLGSGALVMLVQEEAGVFQRVVVLCFITWFTISPLVVRRAYKRGLKGSRK